MVGCDPAAIRTRNLQLRRLLLYPLSYGAEKFFKSIQRTTSCRALIVLFFHPRCPKILTFFTDYKNERPTTFRGSDMTPIVFLQPLLNISRHPHISLSVLQTPQHIYEHHPSRRLLLPARTTERIPSAFGRAGIR